MSVGLTTISEVKSLPLPWFPSVQAIRYRVAAVRVRTVFLDVGGHVAVEKWASALVQVFLFGCSEPWIEGCPENGTSFRLLFFLSG